MANEKTILLGGTEQEVRISGQNCGIRSGYSVYLVVSEMYLR